jgi:HD superfamily phosphodiesterase
MNLDDLQPFILHKMEEELSPKLWYHGVYHTLSVINSCKTLARHQTCSAEEMVLLQTAALLHDVGFIWNHEKHEEKGAQYARKILPKYNYSAEAIKHIEAMILATKIPQKAHSKLAKILCDADVFYLGSDFFYTIGRLLFLEFKARNVVETEEQWNNLQISFLSKHNYLTDYAKKNLEPKKQQYLNELKEETKFSARQ